MRLIKEQCVEKAFKEGKMIIEVEVPGTIVTPQAESTAQKLGVKIVKKETSLKKISYSDRKKIIEEIRNRYPAGKYSRALIERAIDEVISNQ